MKRRVTFTVEFQADLDMVPGAWHEAKDWHNLAMQEFNRPSTVNVYNVSARVIESKEESLS